MPIINLCRTPLFCPIPTPAIVIDFHSHLIPGVDDGAATLDQSLAAIAEMRRDGIRQIVTTPHLPASLLRRVADFTQYMDRIDAAWTELQAAADTRFPDIDLARGVELALDILPPRLTDERLFLAGTRFVLVEFPHLRVPPNSDRVLREFKANGLVPILAHPERYTNLDSTLELARAWKANGAFLQMNAGSLTGQYGELSRSRAETMIAEGLADYLSSDYHARGACMMQRAVRVLSDRGMEEQARALSETNAKRMLAGHDPEPVSGSAAVPPSAWHGLLRLFRRR
jgi:protein-tyrosine phosphatase